MRDRVVDGASLRLWARVSLDALGEARATIDALNVFPVADGDTGTNMYLTLESACAAVEERWSEAGASLADVASGLATGALLGARGNSGVILAQVLRGIADVAAAVPEGADFDADVVRAGLRRAADGAYSAVAEPVEGTILTVAREAAEAAEAYPGADLDGLLEAVTAAAHDALARTPDLLPVLKDAGVVDSGGQGLVVVYDSLLDVVTGVRRHHDLPKPRVITSTRHRHHIEASPAFEVMYLFDGDAAAARELQDRLRGLGDSLVVTGSTPLWNVHVHVHDAGAAIEAALDIGRPHRLRVTHLVEARPAVLPSGRSIVAVAHGPGVASLLAESGVIVVPAQPGRRPSTGEILDGVSRAGTDEVIVVPSDSDTIRVAEVAAEQARHRGIRVAVLPSRSVVQTLAGVAVHDPSARFDDDVVAMTRAVSATRYGAVTIASRAALTSAGPCEVGDVLGLADGDIVEIGSEIPVVARDLLGRMLSAGAELVTIVTGVDDVDAEDLEDWLGLTHPTVDVVRIDGGQPLWPLILGVE